MQRIARRRAGEARAAARPNYFFECYYFFNYIVLLFIKNQIKVPTFSRHQRPIIIEYMRFFLLVLLWCWPLFLSGQELFMKVFNHLNGLPTNTIYDIAASKKGYLYLATDYGIYSFNGREFKMLPLFECKATTFTDLCFDYKGRLWTRNFSNEIFCLERDTLRLMTRYFSKDSDNLSISRLLAADQGVYINDQLRVIRLDLKTMKTRDVVEPKEFERRTVSLWDFAIDSSGNIYMKSDNNLWVKRAGRGITTFVAAMSPELNAAEGHFGYNFGVVHYTPILEKELRVYDIYSPDSYANRSKPILKAAKGLRGVKLSPSSIWFCSASGLFHYKENGDLDMVLPEEYYTTKIVQDFEGGYWVATIGHGLIYIPNLNTRWTRAKSGYFTVLEAQDEKTILVGANQGGILAVDTSGRTVFNYMPKGVNDIQFIYFDSLRQRVYHTSGYHSLNNNLSTVNSPLNKTLLRLDEKHMIVGAHNGAYIINEDINKAVALPKPASEKLDSTALAWYRSLNNNFALLLRYGRVRASCNGLATTFFMAFVDGLFVFDKQTLSSKPITTGLGRPIYATSLTKAGDTLWVGTFQQGIFAINQNTNNIIAHYTTDQGLSSNQSNKIFIAEDRLWILSAQGIDLLNIKIGLIENVSKKYTLDMTAINDVLIMGRYLWLSSNEGLLRMDNIKGQTTSPPRLIIHNINYGAQPFNPYSPYSLVLGKSGEQLQFIFETISFRNRQKLSYEYRILGLNRYWQNIDAVEQKITLPVLPSGKYILQFRIKDPNLTISYPQYQFKFQIYPSFLKSTEFKGVLSIVLATIIWLITYLYNTYYLKWHSMHIKVITSQLTSLRARMNPHFLNNTLNTIQALVQADDKKLAIQSIAHFSTLMRRVLDTSAEENITLTKELDALQTYLELERLRFRQELKSTIVFDFPPDVKPENLRLPSMIIQPIVENAIKHGLMHKSGKKELNIECFLGSNNNLFIVITDNGIGRKAAALINAHRPVSHVSFATDATEKRIELINQLRTTEIEIEIETIDRYDSSQQSLGTTVILSIPLDY
jgi:ligand-binding sensor domain-containing protein